MTAPERYSSLTDGDALEVPHVVFMRCFPGLTASFPRESMMYLGEGGTLDLMDEVAREALELRPELRVALEPLPEDPRKGQLFGLVAKAAGWLDPEFDSRCTGTKARPSYPYTVAIVESREIALRVSEELSARSDKSLFGFKGLDELSPRDRSWVEGMVYRKEQPDDERLTRDANEQCLSRYGYTAAELDRLKEEAADAVVVARLNVLVDEVRSDRDTIAALDTIQDDPLADDDDSDAPLSEPLEDVFVDQVLDMADFSLEDEADDDEPEPASEFTVEEEASAETTATDAPRSSPLPSFDQPPEVLCDIQDSLVTKKVLAKFLEVGGAGWYVNRLRPHMPGPIWKAPRCHPWYHLGDLVRAFEKVSGEDYITRPLNDWLLGHLKGLQEKPPWHRNATVFPGQAASNRS